MVSHPPVRWILARLAAEGHIDRADVDGWASRSAAPSPDDVPTPWFVRVIVGAAAWTAALSLTAFAGSILEDSPARAPLGVISGVVCAVLAVIVRRRLRRAELSTGIAADFWTQVALTASVLARLLIWAGIEEQTGSHATAALALLALEAFLLAFYPDALQRFIVPITSGAWLLLLATDWPAPAYPAVMTVLSAVLTGLVWVRQARLLQGPLRAWQAPLGYGLATGLCGNLVLGFSTDWVNSPGERLAWIVSAGMTALLVALVGLVLREHGARPAAPVTIAAVAAALLFAAAAWREPGLIMAVALAGLGFHARARPLVVLAGLFLIGFGVHFYYTLEMGLLQKTGILVGSGLVLLAVAVVLRRLPGRSAEEVT